MAEDFLKYAGPLLYKDESTNSLMLGLCGNIIRAKEPPKETPILMRILKDDQTVSVALQTPPANLVITYATSEELEALAIHLNAIGAEFPGVVGPAKESEIFAAIWAKLKHKNSTLGMGQKIYKVEAVALPNTPGSLRLAKPQEVDLIAQWIVEFSEESLPPPERKSFEDRRSQALRSLENQLAYIWENNGKPVSMAHIGRPTQNGISISCVYTPKNLRKNGYASAVVANLSQLMLNSGKTFCVLYTDLSNPTSNKIYQNIGYREVSDSKHFLFENLVSLRTPTENEFSEAAAFSFQNFIEETAKSSGQSIDELRLKFGGPPTQAGPYDIWYIVEKKKQKIGFIWVEIDPIKKSAFGYDIYLDPAHRSQGIGREVMELCGGELRKKGIDTVSICVFHHNTIARALYSSLGFIETDFNEPRQQYTLTLNLKK
ncbi:MAG: GNAT family N-acetyltransferase [Pseudobdellovibrionaceae bacterium]